MHSPFCSSAGKNLAFSQTAARFGELLARNGQTLVYGGSNVGLMKVIATRRWPKADASWG